MLRRLALALTLVLSTVFAPVAAAAPTPSLSASAPTRPALEPVNACPTNLFISEYIEGSSFNKAIELYNGTEYPISVSGTYSLALYTNGSASVSQSVVLSGTIAPDDVYVLAHGSAAVTITVLADQISSAVINFNGDDALALFHNGQIIDTFGQIGFDPGTEWGTGLVSTVDNTLVRKSSIISGDTNGANDFGDDLAAEWDGYANNTLSELGAHTIDPCSFGAELEISKSGPELVGLAAPITYTLTLSATGSLSATSTILTDTLPAGVDFVTYTTDLPVSFSQPTSQELVWDLGTLPVGSLGVTVSVQAVLSNTIAAGAWLTNTVSVSTATTETVTADNTAEAYTLVGAPNLALAKSGPAADIVAGSDVTFTLSYSNTGDVDMTGVVLVDSLPGGLTYVEDSASGVHANGFVTWTLGSVGVGVSGTILLTGTASAAGVFTNTAVLTSGLPETTLDDNFAQAGVTILGADPYVTKTGPATLQQGKRITYTIGYGNNGQLSTTVTLTDTLPAGFDVDNIAFDDSGLSVVDNLTTRTWLAGTVLGNTHFSFTLALTMPVSVVENDVFTNTVHLTTTAIGDDPGNNLAEFTTTVLAPDPCDASFIEISALQGPTATSPYLSQAVTTRGIVTGDYQGSVNLSGYFLQDEDGGDGDPATSDGLFVFNNSLAVSAGDLIVASGTITEFNTLTELGAVTTVTVCSTGHALAPTVLTLPVDTLGDHERYEGMYVTIPQTLTAQQNFFQGRYGQVTLAADGRLYNPTNGNDLGEDLEENTKRMLVLDDGLNDQNPNPIPYIGDDNTLRAGDVVSGLTGLLDYGQINSDFNIRFYRLHPTAPVTFTRVNDRPALPGDVGGHLRVGSFNVLNYFNGDGLGGGFPTSRGADSLTEFIRQEAKIITALVALDADVVGLMEIENDGTGAQSAIQALVDRLNEETAPGTYAFVAEPDPGTDEIKVALIYQPAAVTPVGLAVNYQVTDHITYTGELFDRTPLAQTFQDNLTGQTFTVIVNHFKSKGSCPGSGPDLDQGDGQGCWNLKRVEQAAGLLDFIADLQAETGDPDVIVIGDLNSYGAEDPIDTLVAGGLIDQAAQHIPAAGRYSYIFDGFSGYLDHGLSTGSLNPYITGAAFWHINADEPSVIDYNIEFKPQDLYAPDQFRASDHDPVLIGLDLPFPADLSGSSKTVNTTSITGGDLLTYTLTISNSGELTATYHLTDVLDLNLTLVNAPGLNGSTTLTGTGSVGPLAQVLYTVTVQASIAFSGTVNNTAQLAGDGQVRHLAAPAVTVAQYIYRLLLPIIMR